MLLPQTIHGFVLKQKDWTLLLVDNVEPVKWNKDAFDRLVVRPSTKEMIKALVMVRIMEREGERVMDLSRKRDDLIAGKGNGLIMLLHGGPGTGKTLTAAEMPLYRVTCGEVGTTAEAVEKYLESILHLGKVWNCVLLLDEADVFLEERSMSDLERNSLVSVFLRILEYYDGILILTTNRVGTFDEAFQSRIQVAIHYPTLDYLSRKRIWENFFHLLYDDEQDADVDELRRHTEQLAEHQMNGRQIRNILTTARQLALYKQETLTWKHVDQAMTTAKDFSRYLQNVHGHSDEQWAREEKLR
ncbi:P-loop containing nucleoside triphosphate hydrolase protein [Stachybotrys elegans]|uniref:P-loop containing nucleoside triphosphate hydrolase protein n=1 Tax=Stachybotrys elegans TaxID=80388 RepID=A0A8K0SYG7_9HYPO|nr:P-loop containing nucleoside triphosphate hydrolase protein [Stachybotrys elegans]